MITTPLSIHALTSTATLYGRCWHARPKRLRFHIGGGRADFRREASGLMGRTLVGDLALRAAQAQWLGVRGGALKACLGRDFLPPKSVIRSISEANTRCWDYEPCGSRNSAHERTIGAGGPRACYLGVAGGIHHGHSHLRIRVIRA